MQNFDVPYQFGFYDKGKPFYSTPRGLSKKIVREISHIKNEPKWMLDKRLQALEIFYAKPLPMWGGDLTKINFNNIYYYVKPTEKQGRSWDDIPSEIKNTFDKIGIPEAEKKFLAGVGAQYDCLTGDSLVYGNASAVQIKDIEPGKFVYALNEKTLNLEKQKVLGVACKGKRKVYSLKVAGRVIKCTINHPLLKLQYSKEQNKLRGERNTRWEYMKNLKVGDYIAIAKDIPDDGAAFELPEISFSKQYYGKNQHNIFLINTDYLYSRTQPNLRIPEKTTESLLWLIGLYLGDGYINKFSKKSENEILSIAIPKSQMHLRDKVKQVLYKEFHYRLHDQKEQFRIVIKSQPIIKLFTRLGLRGTAKTKKIPDWIFCLPKSQKLAFIAGYIDSDGTIRHTGKTNDALITSVNYKILERLQHISIICGLHVTGIHSFRYSLLNKQNKIKKTGYRLQITGDLAPLQKYSFKAKQYFVQKKVLPYLWLA